MPLFPFLLLFQLMTSCSSRGNSLNETDEHSTAGTAKHSPALRGMGTPPARIRGTASIVNRNMKGTHPVARVLTAPQSLHIPSQSTQKAMYPWKRRASRYESLASRFPAPAGFHRVKIKTGTYAYYLRHLPLLPQGSKVKSYDGLLLVDSTKAAAAVIDLDVGKRDLQQCMDTIMRIRGEYHWWRKSSTRVKFRYGGGKYFGWAQWKNGIRPRQHGRSVVYEPRGTVDSSRKNFIRYLTFMFAMTGTINNNREPTVKKLADLSAGDFFIHPAPSARVLGHAIIIVDIIKNATGRVKILMAQGYTPAQDFHVIKNPSGGIWYDINETATINTPLWSGFLWKNLRRFRY
ncbi:DUF4846 domain-containing protein [Myxococcota bacterium]|nr:DUF4846 domain-containing protein [Myxococcota bacterium]MBU1535741.1 DUF4846 domain-containing protein [Myxococcota bacterium]